MMAHVLVHFGLRQATGEVRELLQIRIRWELATNDYAVVSITRPTVTADEIPSPGLRSPLG